MTEIELIERIAAKPGMYLGRKTLTGLSHFLHGYAQAMADSGAAYDCSATEGFQEFIAERFGITSSHGWNDIILFFENDENSAFDRAIELLREFLEIQGDAPVADGE